MEQAATHQSVLGFHLLEDVLDLIHKSNAWLEQEVTKAGYNSPDDVFLGEYIDGQLRLIGYSEK